MDDMVMLTCEAKVLIMRFMMVFLMIVMMIRRSIYMILTSWRSRQIYD